MSDRAAQQQSNRKLKVYGWTGSKSGMPKSQARFIVAAPSITEVLRITGMTRYQFNYSGCETGNAEELSQAMSQPGVVFYQQLNAPRDEAWIQDA